MAHHIPQRAFELERQGRRGDAATRHSACDAPTKFIRICHRGRVAHATSALTAVAFQCLRRRCPFTIIWYHIECSRTASIRASAAFRIVGHSGQHSAECMGNGDARLGRDHSRNPTGRRASRRNAAVHPLNIHCPSCIRDLVFLFPLHSFYH